MTFKHKILRETEADLHLSFDVGHSSIGWAVLQTGKQLEIKGCGSVVFRADDCLASSRRAYRRQRRHIRSTRQRIARMKILLEHLGTLTEADFNKTPSSWPWQLAARVLQGGTLEKPSELWDVLRWYAHNRGYDGNRRWSKHTDLEDEAPISDEAALEKILNDTSVTEDEKNDVKKVIESKSWMRKLGKDTMAETFTAYVAKYEKDVLDFRKNLLSEKPIRFKGLNAAFPRKVVEGEVRRILRAHFGKWKGLNANFEKAMFSDWRASEIPCTNLKLPKRYEGGLLFGQLVPRFDNRIISNCPVTWKQEYNRAIEAIENGDEVFMRKHFVSLDNQNAIWWAKHIADKLSKVPSRNCPEFLNFRWAMLLANMKVARPSERELTPLTISERKIIDSAMREKGAMTEGELKKVVREATKSTRDKLDQMFMEELDAKKALVLDPVQELICSDKFVLLWNLLPDRLQKRLRGQWRRGKTFSLVQIRTQLKSLGDASAFDTEWQKQLDAHNSKVKTKDKQLTREQWLQKHFPSKPLKLDGRAAFARRLLKQAFEEVMGGFDPRKTAVDDFKFENGKKLSKKNDGCIFISEEIREVQINRAIADQTNNHLVRHRLMILERLVKDIIKEYAGGNEKLIGKITIEVKRVVQHLPANMSGLPTKETVWRVFDSNDANLNARRIKKWLLAIHSELFLEAAKHGVALIICESFKPVSLVLPANRSTDTILSRAMINLTPKARITLWQKTIDAKCQNQFALAEHISPQGKALETMRGIAFGKKPHKEAICAKMFWQIFGRTLNDEDFIRDRGRGGLNHFLNYGYAVLLSTVLQKLFGVGLDPTFGISHVERERSTPLAYDLMEQFRPCVDWRVCQWVKQHPNPNEWEVTKDFRKWVTGFPLERADYLDLSLEIQGVIEGVVRGFRKAVIENQPRHYKPWTPKNTKWAG